MWKWMNLMVLSTNKNGRQTGSHLALKPYFHSARAVDLLIFKDVFRNALLRNLITTEACERWLQYRDNRNSTAHDYGINFAEETIVLLPQFIIDASALATALNRLNDN